MSDWETDELSKMSLRDHNLLDYGGSGSRLSFIFTWTNKLIHSIYNSDVPQLTSMGRGYMHIHVLTHFSRPSTPTAMDNDPYQPISICSYRL